jgi:hypothetical protein
MLSLETALIYSIHGPQAVDVGGLNDFFPHSATRHNGIENGSFYCFRSSVD